MKSPRKRIQIGKNRGQGVISNKMSSICQNKAVELPLWDFSAPVLQSWETIWDFFELFFHNEPRRSLRKQTVPCSFGLLISQRYILSGKNVSCIKLQLLYNRTLRNMGEKKYIVNLTFDYEPWLVNSIQVLSMALSFAIWQRYNKHRPVKLVNRLISCMFWFKVHTSLDTALEPLRGGLLFPLSSIQAGLSDSSNEQNKAYTWLCDFQDGPQKMNEVSDFLFWITNCGSSQLPCGEDSKATLGTDPCVEVFVSASALKELRFLANSCNGSGYSTWRLKLRLQMPAARQTAWLTSHERPWPRTTQPSCHRIPHLQNCD